jgi:crotonobetainyl-CoA:carnitine CoA-transferase CaiB-like acyl-CoA transferase
MNELPLQGVRVIELGSSIAGPFSALILSQLGAEVIKVEPPDGGDVMRRWGEPAVAGTSAAFETFNRGKRSVVVDFHDAEQVAKLRRFIDAGVDVVMQNLRPGAAERFGLGADTLCAANPQLIYCNLGAFGNRGPMAAQPGYDPLMQAFAGIIAVTGEAERDPARVGVSIIDLSTGMWGAIGILGLLLRRVRTGLGGVADGSLLESSLTWMSLNFGTLQVTGEAPKRSGLGGPLIAPNGGFQARDGIVMIVVGTDAQFARMCAALELSALKDDARFTHPGGRLQHKQALQELLEQSMRCQDRAYWVTRLNAANVPCAPIQDLREAVAHPQTQAMGMVQTGPSGDYAVLGFPLSFDGVRPAYAQRSPRLDEHGELLHDDG